MQQQQQVLGQASPVFHEAHYRSPLPFAHELTNQEKQQAVKDAFVFAWEGYRKHSWGYDENRPVTNQPVNTRNGWGATIVDALDTLYIMGLKDEFQEARDFVANIDWSQADNLVQVFETTIRYVGGLLSAYDLSGDLVFVEKTVELVDRLLPAFDTPTGIPYQYINFKSGRGVKSGFPEGASCLAEIGTVQLEFTRLSQITGNWTYHDTGNKVYSAFHKMKVTDPGLYPHLINADTGRPVGSYVTWGGMGDSFYEYLIKQYVLSDGKNQFMKDMVIETYRAMEQHLLQVPKDHDDLIYLVNKNDGVPNQVMDELACFAPGTILLASHWIDELQDMDAIASGMMQGCFYAWQSTRTGIAPEVFGYIDKDGRSYANLSKRQRELAKAFGAFPVYPSYILRPETLESLFYFHQYTGEEVYQDMAWEIFNAIHTYCRANSGFSGLDNVDSFFPKWDDRQESFMFAETFKYLYLIWDDQPRFPFDEWVFNTEAHPFKIPKTKELISWWRSAVDTVCELACQVFGLFFLPLNFLNE
ncbi:glycoside hydrolase [Hesseltinella vesiculosa]|uniref:alpha-1,2-Mannosidase n=1 Tax=Hesseltinella vesiculosa TaxID=101127 RepID=A0A1X2GD99_9FUNG|nr:glycoside hydrolase [Hesseltinella vesiculosa]